MSINGIGGLEADIRFHRKLMAYRSPWSHTKELGEFYLLRGAIISAFGHADYLAMCVCVRAAQVPEYQFRPKPPTRTGEKINYLREVIAVDGPLSDYSKLLGSAVNRLERLNEFRRLVAHASYQSLGGGTVSFPDTVKVRGERLLTSDHNSTTLDMLREKAMRYARFSRACERAYQKLGALLPEVPLQRGWHSNHSPWRDPIEVHWPTGRPSDGEGGSRP